MIKKILAIVAAAVCAGAIAEFVPGPAPAVAAGASPGPQSHTIVAPVRTAESRKAICSQGWPYYEPACLRDNRSLDGKVRVVRVIAADRLVKDNTLPTRR